MTSSNSASAPDASASPASAPLAAWQTAALSNNTNLSLFDRVPYEWWSMPDFSNRSRARLGPPNASAVLLEFVDYECPHCANARHLTEVALARYPQLALEYRHFPLPQMAYSRQVALAAECAADQGKFWDFSNAVMDDNLNLDFDKQYRLANASGVANLTLWAVCVKSQWHAGVLASDYNESQKYGVDATPTFVLNGQAFATTGVDSQFWAFLDKAMAGRGGP